MKWIKLIVGCGLFVGVGFWGPSGAAGTTNGWPKFQEVYELVRSNLAGVDDAKLNDAAVQGFLKQLAPQVLLDSTPPGAESIPGGSLLGRTSLLDEAYGYVRVQSVERGLDSAVASAVEQLRATNKLRGLILDLRFAGGRDYAAAATTADRFISTDQPLLSWGAQTARSTAKSNALSLPLVALVNRGTAAAAEALAAMLQHYGPALLIGEPTAGQATLFKDFTLSTGQHLRIATESSRLGNGEPLGLQGIKPDIQVVVNPEDERAYYGDAYRVLAKNLALLREADTSASASTNRTGRHRINEAELVRMQKEGQSLDEDTAPGPARDAEPARLTIQDPVLARAVDLLKGLALVQRSSARN